MDHYMAWHHSITRRRISPPIDLAPEYPHMEYQPLGAATHRLVEGVVSIARRSALTLHETNDDAGRVMYIEIIGLCRSMLEDVGEGGQLERVLRELEPPIRGQG
ncbi:hypothetical protein L1049_017523 [Liquidambar formosana]|uniref:Uncharacterized protein n=1 Tax=Liquidambar formosana TaxID=63359 RepID=A0AAP0S7K9_LIQFO